MKRALRYEGRIFKDLKRLESDRQPRQSLLIAERSAISPRPLLVERVQGNCTFNGTISRARDIKTSRGKAMRRLIYDTFLRFFNGTTPHLDWADTARQMSV